MILRKKKTQISEDNKGYASEELRNLVVFCLFVLNIYEPLKLTEIECGTEKKNEH